MRTGKGRIQLAGLQLPVKIGGANVNPGDLVCGDPDGVVVIPSQMQEQVLSYAEEIYSRENQVRKSIREGMRMDEARKLQNYHLLQSQDYDQK
jgi:regulator of RNase E activity RraA